MDKATKALGQRVAALEKLIHTLPNTPGKQNEKPVSNASDTDREINSLAATASRLTNRNPTPKQSHDTKQKWYQSFKWWKSRIQFAALIAGVGYAFVTYFQWKDLRRNFITNERAWMKISAGISDLSDVMSVKMEVKNVGKSVVSKIVVYAALEVVNKESSPDFFHAGLVAYFRHVAQLFPNDTTTFVTTPTAHSPTGNEEPRKLTIMERDSLRAGQSYIAVYATAIYTDQFGAHWTRFCAWQAYATSDFAADACTSYNAVGEGDTVPRK